MRQDDLSVGGPSDSQPGALLTATLGGLCALGGYGPHCYSCHLGSGEAVSWGEPCHSSPIASNPLTWIYCVFCTGCWLASATRKPVLRKKKNKNKEKNIWHQNKKRKFIMRLMLLKHATSFLLWPQWFFRPSRWKSKPLNPNSSPSIFDASQYLTKKELFCPAKLPSSSALEITFIFNSMLSAMLVPPFDRASFLLSLTKSYPHVSVQSQVPQAPHAAATAGLVCGL